MINFDNINVGDTITLIPDLKDKRSSLYYYCNKRYLEEFTTLVIGKYKNMIAVLALGHDFYLNEGYMKLYDVPDIYRGLYMGSGFFGVTPAQVYKIMKISSESINNIEVIDEDRGGLSFL